MEPGFAEEDCGRKVCLPVVVLSEGGWSGSEGSDEGARSIPGGICHGFAGGASSFKRAPFGEEGLKETAPELSTDGADQGVGAGSGVCA